MSLGARLREVRTGQAVSLSDLAVRAGLRSSYIADVEAGYAVPSHETLEIWARALGVPFYQLFFSKSETASTPRLGPRVNLDDPGRPWERSTLNTLLEWLLQVVFVLFRRVPQERSGG
jgi:transcriptional regulator with XRE-family HTH domain